MDWEFRISRCKLLHTEGTNKDILYSMQKYMQDPVIHHNGKEYEKTSVHIHIYA